MVKTEQFRLDVLAALNTVAAARDTHADFSRYGYGTWPPRHLTSSAPRPCR